MWEMWGMWGMWKMGGDVRGIGEGNGGKVCGFG